MDTKCKGKLSLRNELQNAELGDLRRTKRLCLVAEDMQAAPAEGYPSMMGSEAALEGYYRLINNEAVEPQAIIEPHYQSTARRTTGRDRVLAMHDQTIFRFDLEDQQEAMGHISTGSPGFFGQYSMIVDAEALNDPLGLSCMSTLFREEESSYPSDADKPGGQDYADQEDLESEWWLNHVEATDELIDDEVEVVHVMDSGADSYERYDKLDAQDHFFVVRKAYNRNARRPGSDQWSKLETLLEESTTQAVREIRLSRRSSARAPKSLKTHPPRNGRCARLGFSACPVEIKSPRYLDGRTELKLWAVRAREIDPPEGEEPVNWLLLTNLEVDDVDDILEVIDYYRARWRIEQLFKALKTGCAFRERQLENRRAILNALAISSPMAWLLMALRGAFHERPDAPAAPVLGDVRMTVLRQFAARPVPDGATVEQAMLAVAGMGGHKKSNGPPGWLTLGRGFRHLRALTQGWLAAKNHNVKNVIDG
jgi:hypothetical protein